MLNRNKGLFGSAPPPPPAQPEQQRPSFFGHNGTGRNIAGSIGDALLQMNGMRPQFAPARQQQQVMDYQTRQAKTEREARMQDWIAQQDYARANQPPDVPTPGSFEWYQTATPEARAQYDEYNPVTVATGAGPVRVPRNRPALGSTIRMDELSAPTPTRQNTPAPALGANGLPSELTRQQYQALLNDSGGNAAGLNDYLARMGIRVGN